jgi:predicted ArsR family transcriptional regulator
MTTLQQQARALGDPTRHGIFRHVADANRPVDIAELTDTFGLNHNAVRQHLAKLVRAGLLVESQAAGAGRGRPRLVYRLDPSVDSRWGAIGPYERLSVLLAEVVRTGDSPVEVGSRSIGRGRLSHTYDEPVTMVVDVMDRQGFRPSVSATQGDRIELVLRACPFASAALVDPDTVCGIHLGIAEGVAALTGDRIVVDELVTRDPRRAHCRLRMHLVAVEGEIT